ncbi:MAG: hypothetical protein AAB483_01070 [Patescibacteria group bacterium]
MAKSQIRIQARKLRKNGRSIKDIARLLKMPKSTISYWCRDIELTKEQNEALTQLKQGAVRQGQLNGALVNKKKRLARIELYRQEGKEVFQNISKEEYFVAGLMLYLAEGSKKNRNIDFVNSDPEVIKFMLHWFYRFFSLSPNNFTFRVSINKIHKSRDRKIKEYWATYLKLPLDRFQSTVFLQSKQNKRYENHDEYFGTFRLRMLKGTDLLYRILGLISGFLDARKPA